jgi:leucyl aminopeptidase
MLKKQETFNLSEEKKICVLSTNLDNEVVKGFLTKLGLEASDLEDMEIVNTLGKLPMKKIVFIKEDKLSEPQKLSKIFDLKEDLLVLVDTFKETKKLLIDLIDASYKFNGFKSKEEKKNKELFYYSKEDLKEVVNESIVYGEAINNTKDLVNKPYNYLNAIDLSEYAKTLARFDNLTVDIYDKAQIQEMKMGAFLGVNYGSFDEPRLIHLKYRGDSSSKDITTLIGKGVMYDTGGYSIKTGTGMPNMKCDMAGSATVLGAIEVIARMGYKKNVDVVIAATDNRIGDGAIVPDDILTSANGKTIEIISTDAEGRLTLADALWFAQKKGGTKLIDIATLTGAVVAALGKEFTGVFTNNEEFLGELIKVSKKTKEKLWQMPISEGYRKELKSYAADMRNTGTSRTAGASVAACFLEEFVEDNRPWIHIDIAATAFDPKTGGSGVMVRTLAELFK